MTMKNTNRKDQNTIIHKKTGTSSPKHYTKKGKRVVEQEVHFNYYIIPVFIILCIIPLIIRLKVYNTNLSQYPWFSEEDAFADFFLYYKHWFFFFIAGGMATIIALKAYFNQKQITFLPIFVPLAAYGILSLLSAIFSDYSSFSFTGGFEQFESVFALLGYCVIVYYAYIFIRTENDLRLIVKYLVIVALIMSVFGIFQFIGKDLVGTKFFNHLIVPVQYQNGAELSFKFEQNRVYLTLYNPNYVGVYVSLVAPIIMVMLFFQKKIKLIILSTLALLGLIMCAIGAQSLAGIMGLGAAILFILIFMWRYLLKKKYITIAITVFIVISLFALNAVTNQLLLNKMTSMFSSAKAEYPLTAMDTKNDCVSLTYNNNNMYIRYVVDDLQTASLIITDASNSVISSNYDPATNSYSITDERFTGITAGISGEFPGMFYIQVEGQQWLFTNQNGDGNYYHLNRMYRLDKMVTAPSALFTGYEHFATNRGYIWSRTIPLLKDYLILGSGPDTFTLVYPQQDYVNFQRYGYGNGIITKPHSLYLQIATQTGMLSLIAFLVFYAMYFVGSFRLYIKGCFRSYYAKVGVAIFVGTIAYMATGLTNDSSITTAPMFWTMMGIGIGVNQKAKPLVMEEAAAMRLAKEKNESK